MKKPSLALVVGSGKGKEEDDESEDYDSALDELAEVMGVSEEDREDFMAAFKAAVSSCK